MPTVVEVGEWDSEGAWLCVDRPVDERLNVGRGVREGDPGLTCGL